jgi:hypothetical protein
VTRLALIVLGALIGLGLIISILPSPKSQALANVTLEDVDLELYPIADPDAKWTFKAGNVVYNPDSRESTVDLVGKGKRLVKGKTDLEIEAETITIDSADNIRTQYAEVYVPQDCITASLGYTSSGSNSQPVFIDQNSGYRAPYVSMKGPDFEQSGTDFEASFDLTERVKMKNPNTEFSEQSTQKCVKGAIVKEPK